MPISFRFPFSADDIALIDPVSLQVNDIPPMANPVSGQPAPGAFHIQFQQRMSITPVQIRPIVPGKLKFIADPYASGSLPAANNLQLTSATYAGWKTEGQILITIEDQQVMEEMQQLAPDMPVLPNRFWYGPVRLPEEFLFETLISVHPR